MDNFWKVWCAVLAISGILLTVGIVIMADKNMQLKEKYEQHLRVEHNCMHYME